MYILIFILYWSNCGVQGKCQTKTAGNEASMKTTIITKINEEIINLDWARMKFEKICEKEN